jgi:hypothetical protein
MVGWFVLAILLPGTINLAATLVFPAPSRTEFINERRSINFELAQESDKSFDQRVQQFLAAHPQYPPATKYKYDRSALLWMDTAQRHVETAKQLQPLTGRFDKQLQRQRQFSKYLSVLSPLTIMQNLLPEIAGSGRMRYQNYLGQVNEFQRRWRELLWTKEFFQIPMSSTDYDLIPRFKFIEGPVGDLLKQICIPVLLLTFQAALALFFGLRFFRAHPSVQAK